MPNNDANIVIKSLQSDTTNLNLSNSDSSSGIEAPKIIEQVAFSQNAGGKYERNPQVIETGIKKDVEARADELSEYQNNVDSFTNLAKISDNNLLSIATQINQKKQLIIAKVTEAISAGCSFGAATAVVNGVTVGVGSAVVEDYAYIKKYSALENYSSSNPFSSDDTLTLTSSNSGTGYFSGFTANGGVTVGTYYTVFNGVLPPSPPTICATRTAEIDDLATEINTLRSQINNSLISNTNSIKDKKTESEIFVWGYRSRENKVSGLKQSNDSVIGIINNESQFQ